MTNFIKIKIKVFLLFTLLSSYLIGQYSNFTRKDSLRGALRSERNYDVLHYDLHVTIDVDKKYISGYNVITYKGLSNVKEMQIDLFDNLDIVSIKNGSKELKYRREFNAVFIDEALQSNQTNKIRIDYKGYPLIAQKAPWDGGFVWSKDEQKNPWVGVACEGIGASLWWPTKDHLSDKPESMDIYITTSKDLVGVSNGRLIETIKSGKNQMTYHWKVSYPINNYNVSLYIGKYEHFSESFQTKNGENLNLNYYVLGYNIDKAKEHFKQVHKILESLEFYCGPYPFINDDYKLVESPYVGMEHQSGIAYGNNYQRGYLGGVIPNDLNFDYIILHESAHEYWGNSVTCKDHADLWIHEGFATYMESLYVEYTSNKESALKYLEHQKAMISNQNALIGPLHVNYNAHSRDIYYKGAWLLQTLRQSLMNDTLWFEIIKGFYNQYKYNNVDTKAFIEYFNTKSKKDYSAVIRQYLYYKNIPKLEFSVMRHDQYTKLKYRWNCDEPNFNIPVDFDFDGKKIRLEPNAQWKNIEFNRVFKDVKPRTKGLLVNVEEVKS